MRAGKFARVWTLTVLLSTGAASTWISCCSMTREELKAMVGTHAECPSSWRIGDRLTQKCTHCPTGTCRVIDDCICPNHFLEQYEKYKDTADPPSFAPPWECAEHYGGKTWPESIEADDRAWRGCGEIVTVTDFGTKACCALTEEELIAASGTSKYCPSSSSFSSIKNLDGKCETCPEGTCRVDLECFCPFNFLRGYEEGRDSYAWNDCKNSFLAAWPESIGNEDTFWRSCTTKEPTTREENNGSSTAPSDGAPDPSPTPSDGDPDPSTAPGGGGGSTTVVAGPSAEKGGINWEKWGGIWGGVGVFVTIIFGIVGVWYSRRQRD